MGDLADELDAEEAAEAEPVVQEAPPPETVEAAGDAGVAMEEKEPLHAPPPSI